MQDPWSAARIINPSWVLSSQVRFAPDTAITGDEVHTRLSAFASWIDVSRAFSDRSLVIRLIALYGQDEADRFGLSLARRVGDPRLMRMAAAQILADFDLGDPEAVAFMALPPDIDGIAELPPAPWISRDEPI